MLDQLIMIGNCLAGNGTQCGGMTLQDVGTMLAVLVVGSAVLLIAYKKFLARGVRKLIIMK